MAVESKETIRRRLSSRRDRLTLAEVSGKGSLIQDRLLQTGLLKTTGTVALYSPIRNEVGTEKIFDECRRLKKQVVFPRVNSEIIEFATVGELSELLPGRWGILEPREGEVIPLGQIDLVVVPGIAFDRNGYRLGYGKGFYDRTLASFPGLKVGLAYDFQILEKIPHDAADLRCDQIFTETF